MSVAAASGAVSTQQHRATQEQIRLAQLIEDKKHDQPEVQEILRKVLDVVANSNQDDVLVALFDCDYDFEKTVALLIEKGRDVSSEWRTATNHKVNKKQQQKAAVTKNGHGETDENAQPRGNEGSTSRGKSRGGRGRPPQNGGDSQSTTNQQQAQYQQNENYNPQQRQRGSGRSRYRGHMNRGGHRASDRNYPHVQDATNDSSLPSDTNRRSRGGGANATATTVPAATTVASSQQQELFDVGNWDGKTLIYSRSIKDDEQPVLSTELPEAVPSSQPSRTNQDASKPNFDPIEAARQIKNVIGIGQPPKASVPDQVQKSKIAGTPLNTKLTPPPSSALRIPQQAVVFSDHFEGGVPKIDVQFGNLSEPFDEASAASSTTAFYQPSQTISSNKASQRAASEQSSHIAPSPRSTEQPVMNQQQPQQQRVMPTQIQQQPTIPMKPTVTPQYAVHQQQHPMNAPNVLLQSLLYHPSAEPVTLETSYDPTTFPLAPIDITTPYFMSATINQPVQQSAQQRYVVSQQPQLPQQTPSKNVPTSSGTTSTSTTTAKKGPAVPPGIFPTVPGLNPAAYSTTYGVQQQTAGANYSAQYDTEHLFQTPYIPLTNTPQAQSPSGTYGSVTPPVQQQTQQTNTNNDNKAISYGPPFTENLMLIQQYQQYTLQQSNSQQQGQQAATHSPAQLSYFLGHAPTPSYSGPTIMYAQTAATIPQHQQAPKQQGQQYNQNNTSTTMAGNDAYYSRGSSTSNKEGQYMYTAPNQPQHGPPQSAGQQQNVNKQQQQRTSGNVYNNQQGQQRPYH